VTQQAVVMQGNQQVEVKSDVVIPEAVVLPSAPQDLGVDEKGQPLPQGPPGQPQAAPQPVAA
jgi:hypothetical protein